MGQLAGRRYRVSNLLLGFAVVGIPAGVLADNTFKSLRYKRTYLNYKGIGHTGQQLPGFWKKVKSRKSRYYHFQYVEGRKLLVAHSGDSPGKIPWYRSGTRFSISKSFNGVFKQFRYAKDRCFNGIAATIEKRIPGVPPRCPQYQWWSPSSICFDKQHRHARENISARQHDDTTCQVNNSPDPIKNEFERFIGVSFAPFVGQRYIYRFQTIGYYELAVKLAWDYRELAAEPNRPVRARLVLENKNALMERAPLSGTYTFRTKQPGKYVFSVEVFNAKGDMIHRDYATAIIPAV